VRRVPVVATLLAASLLAGCSMTSHAGTGPSGRLPPVLAKVPPGPATLRPVATSTTLGHSGKPVLTASLTGNGDDMITVQTTQTGDGQVTVTSGTAVLFHKEHVSGASVLVFGRDHLPVLLLQDSYNLCGSGGCVTSAYTWSPAKKAMVAVPQPRATGYLYSPAKRQFHEVAIPQFGSLFGYIVPGRRGIVLTARTYDAWQHDVAQDYAYAPDLSPTGGWVQVGNPRFAPAGSQPGINFADPGQALLALLSARSLGFRSQVQQVATTAAAQRALWRNLRAIVGWRGSLFAILPSPEVQSSASFTTASDRVSGLVGSGPTARLEVYEVTAELSKRASAYAVASAHVAPVAVKVPSAVAVLTLIRARAALRKGLAEAGDPPLLIQAVGQDWQVEFGARDSAQTRPWIQVDAVTGAVSRGS